MTEDPPTRSSCQRTPPAAPVRKHRGKTAQGEAGSIMKKEPDCLKASSYLVSLASCTVKGEKSWTNFLLVTKRTIRKKCFDANNDNSYC